MDFHEQTPSLRDYMESPAKLARPKERSQFKFNKDYLNAFSDSPVSID